MSVRPVRGATLWVVAAVATACGGAARSVHTTTRPVAAASLPQVVQAGRLQLRLPSSWAVGRGTCRCGWGRPDTATLDNGPQVATVACSCPAQSGSAPSGLHLYEGDAGLVAVGTPRVINGVGALVSLDASTAVLSVVVPGVDQRITVGPAPSGTIAAHVQQVALERQILATVEVTTTAGGGAA